MPSAKDRPRVAAMSQLMLGVVVAVALVVPTTLTAVPAAAQEGAVSFSTAEAAPADAVTYVVTTLNEQSEQWQLADELLDRAGVGEALDQAIASELEDEGGEDLPLDAFLGGEVAIVFTKEGLQALAEESMGGADLESMITGMESEEPEDESAEPMSQGFAVILDARAPDTAWAGIRDSAEEDGGSEETYERTTIVYAPPASADEEGMAAARVGDLILIAMAPEDLHPVIDTADGRVPNITTVPEFSEARDALPDSFLTFTFSNSPANFDIDLGPLAPAMEAMLTDAYSASTIAADEPGFRIETVAILAEGATPPPTAEHFESELVTQAPDNSLFFTSAANLGETGILDAFGAVLLGLAFGMGDPTMMEPATPEPGASPEDTIAQQYADAAALIGINLQTDLFQQFVGEYGGWLTVDMAGESGSGLFASHVSDPDTVANALMQLSFLIQGASGAESPLTTREVDGGQVYVIELGDEAGSTLEFGVVGDQFVIGESAAVDRLSGDAGENLASNAQFQAVMDTLPVEGNGTFYIDLAQAIPLMEVASEQADDLGLDSSLGIVDASESCANYATQEEAQVAYDSAEPDTFDLDQDFDGEVCEDFFAPAADEGDNGTDEVEEAFANVDYSAIKAYALVAHEEDGISRTSSILYIAE